MKNLRKDLEITRQNQIWSSDFTHLYYKQREFYLATVLDEYGKNIIGYKLSFHHGKQFIIETVKTAISNAQEVPHILHSDQGSEYRSYDYFDTLKQYNITPSMSRKSSPWENSCQESFYGKMKFELGNLSRFETFEQAIEAIHLWIYYYNNERIHTTLKMSPKQFLEQKSTAKSG